MLTNSHYYLIKISRVEDREIFKICLEYWSRLVREIFEEEMTLASGYTNFNLKSQPVIRKQLYEKVLSSLRVVMIERMVKPEEVLVVENDEGEIVRESLKESDTIVLYKSVKEVLVYLTNFDVADTEEIMTAKLARQMDGSEWSWQNINQLCWAIGSISGAMNEETEKRFLVNVIKNLLNLVEMKRGKDNKAVVASNIMYTVGQYPRFLKAHWKFLKTVINKLFEFMHEMHEGVQDMACDTFIKISQECKRHFIFQQSGEVRPFVEDIIESIDQITYDLTPQQIHTFYEAVGYTISAQSNKPQQERLIANFMKMPNTAVSNNRARLNFNPDRPFVNSGPSIVSSLKQGSDLLNNSGQIKALCNVLKTNIAASRSIGSGYISQLSQIYTDLLMLYRAAGVIVSQNVSEQGKVH